MFRAAERLRVRFYGHANLAVHYLSLEKFQHPISIFTKHGLELTRLQTSEKFRSFVATKRNSNRVTTVLQHRPKEVDKTLLHNQLTPTTRISARQVPSSILQARKALGTGHIG